MNQEEVFKLIKTQNLEQFKESLTELTYRRCTNIKEFFKKLNEIVKYKWKGSIVKEIIEDNNKLSYEESMSKLTDYYKKIFVKDNITSEPIPINNIFNYSINIEEAIAKLAKNKAIGWDKVPAEWIIKAMEDENFKKKIWSYFQKWVLEWKVPDFWMRGKITLINKDKGRIPTAERTRPITILPPILKLFELSIIHNFEKVIYEEKNLNLNQRGFIKFKWTENNIQDVLNFYYEKRTNKNTKERPYLIFIDLHKAYDSVNSEKLLNKLANKKIPDNIIKTLNYMLSRFSVTIDNQTWIKTNTGLPQGSWLSPILFNIYLDDLLNELEQNRLFHRAYADDIIVGTTGKEEINLAWGIIKNWCKRNDVELNASKSGIMRIGYRKCKLQKSDNVLGIKECYSYKYLGLEFDQGLTFNRIPKTLKQQEIIMTGKLKRLNFDVVDIKTRKLVFHCIWMQKLTYGLTSIYGKSKTYNKYIDGLIYRLLKRWFGIRGNPRREKTFELFGINIDKMIMTRKHKFFKNQTSIHPRKYKICIRDECSPQLLNFALERMMPGYKGKKECSWGEDLSFKHLVWKWIQLEGWRRKHKNPINTNYDIFLRQVHRKIKNGEDKEVEESNVMATDFYSTIAQTIVGIWN